MVMIGAISAPAHAALEASAPMRQERFLEFHLGFGCDCDWTAEDGDDVIAPTERSVVGMMAMAMAGANGGDAESLVFIGLILALFLYSWSEEMERERGYTKEG